MRKYFFSSLIAVTIFGRNSVLAKQKNLEVNIDQRLSELNIVLTPPSAPIASYVKTVRLGNLIFTAGHGPDKPDGSRITGRIGEDLTLEQGQEAARLTGIALLSSLKADW